MPSSEKVGVPNGKAWKKPPRKSQRKSSGRRTVRAPMPVAAPASSEKRSGVQRSSPSMVAPPCAPAPAAEPTTLFCSFSNDAPRSTLLSSCSHENNTERTDRAILVFSDFLFKHKKGRKKKTQCKYPSMTTGRRTKRFLSCNIVSTILQISLSLD